jgi:hypothetical protein
MRRLFLCLIIALFASASFGDQLMMGSITKEGSFQGFEKGKFRFYASKGNKLMNEQASRVTTIVLSKPKKCTYLLSSGKKEEHGFLKGFDKDKFMIAATAQDDSAVIPLRKMTKLDINPETSAGGKSGSGDGYPIPSVDLSAFTGNFTPDQQKAMDNFKAAKKVFDDFVKESASMVSQMDSATGSAREDLINQLRKRKVDEQPLRKELVAAYNALMSAFPEKPEETSKQGSAPAQKEQPAPAPEQTQPPDDGMSKQIQDAI